MNDIFISYAHLDDKPLTEGQKGWITKFHRILEVRIGQLLGEEPEIWRDPKLGGSDMFDQAIVTEFQNARVMVSIMTPRYIKSDWCVREFSEFAESAEGTGGIKVQGKSRIFKVVKTPIPNEEIPSQISQVFDGLLGFNFFDIDPDTGKVVEFDDAFGKEAEQNYYARIFDLAHELSELLKQFRKDQVTKASYTVSQTGKRIYLSTTTTDVDAERDKLKRELVERGHTVLPSDNLPFDLQSLQERIREDLENSDIVLHVIGQRYGLVPEGSEDSIPVIQYRLSSELEAKRKMPRVLWFPGGMETEDRRQSSYIADLRQNRELNERAEIMADELDVVRNTVLELLAPPNKAISEPSSTSNIDSSAKHSIYLIHDATDEDAVEPLEDYLFEQGYEVMAPEFEGGEEYITQMHRDKLARCDAALIYYGRGTRAWVETKLMDLMQSPGYGRTKDWFAKAVYVAPPEDRRKRRLKTHFAELIHSDQPFERDKIDQFIGMLQSAR